MRELLRLISLSLALLIPVCAVSQVGPPDAPITTTGVTAHRGDSGAHVENTLAAFRSALALAVDWLECDIFLTADQRLVVTHDLSTLRLTGIDAGIKDLDYEQIRLLDTSVEFRASRAIDGEPLPPQRMPLLEDVLELVMSQSRVRLSIQPKDEATAAAIELIRRLGAERWVGFNDSNLEKMSLVKALAPEIPVFWDRLNDADVAGDIRIALDRGFESLVYNQNFVSAESVAAVHAAGLEYGVWTVNDPALMADFIRLGVDRLYTDYPATALRLYQEVEF